MTCEAAAQLDVLGLLRLNRKVLLHDMRVTASVMFCRCVIPYGMGGT